MNFSQIPFEEFWAFGLYYLPSLGCCVLVTVLVWTFLFRPSQKKDEPSRPKRIYSLLIIPPIIWLLYVAATARNAFAITSLDSEDNLFAANVYKRNFDVILDCATKLETDE